MAGPVSYTHLDVYKRQTESIERSEFLKSANSIKEVVTSPWFLLIIGLIVLLVLVYIVLAVIYNRKKKNLRKVKKYKDL